MCFSSSLFSCSVCCANWDTRSCFHRNAQDALILLCRSPLRSFIKTSQKQQDGKETSDTTTQRNKVEFILYRRFNRFIPAFNLFNDRS